MLSAGETVRPADESELVQLIAGAADGSVPLEARGGGSKRDIGKPDREAVIVDLSAFAGVIDYDASELFLTVRPATPLAEVEALLHENGQMLAFEPWDHGPLFGRQEGAATIGGIVAAGVSGSRRVTAGGVRDHLLGFSAVSGRGEVFKAGGKVVKNVTGFDLSKVMTGSWGQLAIITELTLKVVPRPSDTRTIAVAGLNPDTAIAVMARALGSRVAPTAAAHLPESDDAPPLTLVRLEGIAQSVEARSDQLVDLLDKHAAIDQLNRLRADGLWAELRGGCRLASSDVLWRVHLAPSKAAVLARKLEAAGATWCFDWGGALVWVGATDILDVRTLASGHGAHAMLMRAPPAVFHHTSSRHPENATVAALSTRVKRAFDPAGILSPARFD